MGKRVSGAPRRPRNPVAKAVRTPLFRQRVVPDKRGRPSGREALEEDPREDTEADKPAKGHGKDDADV